MNIIDELILKKFSEGVGARKGQEPTSPGLKAAITLSMGLIPLAYQLAVRRAVNPWVLPQIALMGGLGYAIPTIYDSLIQKENPEEAAMRAGEQIVAFPELNKTSGFASAMGGAALTAGKYALRGIRDIAKGVVAPLPRKGMSFGQGALSVGSKALVGYGAYKGGKALYNNYIRRPDYSTYLRNQVLAGNIQPQELGPSDIESIRKISSLKIPINPILGGLFTITSGIDAAKSVRSPIFQPAKKLPQTAATWQPY